MFKWTNGWLQNRLMLEANGNGNGGGTNDPKSVTMTEADLNALIDKRVTSAVKTREANIKAEYDSTIAGLQGKITQYEDANLSAEALLAKKEKEYETLINGAKADRNRAKVESMFAKENLLTDDISPILDGLVDFDEAKSLDRAGKFMASLKAVVDSQVKLKYDDAVKSMPKPKNDGNGNGSGAITKEAFNKMTFTEKVKFKQENPELYKSFL